MKPKCGYEPIKAFWTSDDRTHLICRHPDGTYIAGLNYNAKTGRWKQEKCGFSETVNAERYIKQEKIIHTIKEISINEAIGACEKSMERCDICSREINAPPHIISVCPECGNDIKPCNQCTAVTKREECNNIICPFQQMTVKELADVFNGIRMRIDILIYECDSKYQIQGRAELHVNQETEWERVHIKDQEICTPRRWASLAGISKDADLTKYTILLICVGYPNNRHIRRR